MSRLKDIVLVSSSYKDYSIIFKKNEIMETWEVDWDDDQIYFKVNSNGKITKVHIETGDVYEYYIEEVVH